MSIHKNKLTLICLRTHSNMNSCVQTYSENDTRCKFQSTHCSYLNWCLTVPAWCITKKERRKFYVMASHQRTYFNLLHNIMQCLFTSLTYPMMTVWVIEVLHSCGALSHRWERKTWPQHFKFKTNCNLLTHPQFLCWRYMMLNHTLFSSYNLILHCIWHNRMPCFIYNRTKHNIRQ